MFYYVLDLSIQKGEHSSVIDARATMDVFKIVRHDWEQSLLLRPHECPLHPSGGQAYVISQTDSTGNTDCSDDDDVDEWRKDAFDDISYLSDKFWPDN